MNTEPKPVEERDTLDLLELVCQLHSRALIQPGNKNMHDAYVEARQEMERRIKGNNNLNTSTEATHTTEPALFYIRCYATALLLNF